MVKERPVGIYLARGKLYYLVAIGHYYFEKQK